MPSLARQLLIKPVFFHIAPAPAATLATLAWRTVEDENYLPPPGYPQSSSAISLRPKDLSRTRTLSEYFAELDPPGRRVIKGIAGSEAFAIWSCREIDSQFPRYLQTLFQKPLFLTGPLSRKNRVISPPPSPEDMKWVNWMNKFPPKSIVYCAFGSEFTPEKDQFMEILSGFELCSRPFIVATTKPPRGCSTIEESFPAGFSVGGRGMVYCGWVPQVEILEHESVGCFVSHCGSSSMWEALFSECRIVLMPNIVLQSLTARFMAEEMKVAVEVEEDGGGWIWKEELSRAIGMAMDEDGEVGQLMKRNHDMYRSMITGESVQDSYTHDFFSKLCALVE
ncbi:UDP-glycosyltransferase 79B6 [Linum grandiflorum]